MALSQGVSCMGLVYYALLQWKDSHPMDKLKVAPHFGSLQCNIRAWVDNSGILLCSSCHNIQLSMLSPVLSPASPQHAIPLTEHVLHSGQGHQTTQLQFRLMLTMKVFSFHPELQLKTITRISNTLIWKKKHTTRIVLIKVLGECGYSQTGGLWSPQFI